MLVYLVRALDHYVGGNGVFQGGFVETEKIIVQRRIRALFCEMRKMSMRTFNGVLVTVTIIRNAVRDCGRIEVAMAFTRPTSQCNIIGV